MDALRDELRDHVASMRGTGFTDPSNEPLVNSLEALINSHGEAKTKELREALAVFANSGVDDFGGSYVNLQVDREDIERAKVLSQEESNGK